MDAQNSLEEEVQDAVDRTGYGRFHYKLFIVSFMIFMNTGFGLSSTALIVPAAACDLQMTTVEIGRLNAALMLGMVCGSYFWGCLADMKGRKLALLVSLFLDACAGMVASIVSNFWFFAFLRFLNGFAVVGQGAMVFPYLGEFQPSHIRRKVLACMEMAWAMGAASLPLLGWIIIPMTFRHTWGDVSFASWNLFVLLCSMLPFSIGIALSFLPETPKYLVEDGREIEAIRILELMYAENTGNQPENYPKVKFLGDDRTDGVISTRGKTEGNAKELKRMLKDIVDHTVTIVRPPYLAKTLLTGFVQFVMMASAYTMIIWFPEIFQRFANFEKSHPGGSADICTLNSITSTNETIRDYRCGTPVAESVYLFSLFLGLACIPTSIWLPLCIDRLGYKFFLVFSTTVAGLTVVGMFYVESSLQNLVLSCIFEAMLSMGVDVVYCITVEFYPTHLRVIAAALFAFVGRTGALIGNLMFGSLFDINCVVPIAVVACLLLGGATLSFFLPGKAEDPKTKNATEAHEQR